MEKNSDANTPSADEELFFKKTKTNQPNWDQTNQPNQPVNCFEYHPVMSLSPSTTTVTFFSLFAQGRTVKASQLDTVFQVDYLPNATRWIVAVSLWQGEFQLGFDHGVQEGVNDDWVD